jgi:broad specificity phosphatase PhoE
MPHPTRVLLLRHALTAAPDQFHGAESDVGLGPGGFEQARRVAARIAAERPDAVYSSGMRRAAETARVIAEACGLDPLEWPGLHERRMGPMSGMPRAGGWSVYEQTKAHWIAGRLDFTHEGGESFAVMSDRATAAFRALLDREAGRTVVVVAHGVLNRVLLASMLEGHSHADFERISIDFVGVHDLRWDGARLALVETWPGEANTPVAPADPAGEPGRPRPDL